ncbi:cytochrome P450 [Diplogelasinospora grovesii]|uniref:Cytochrome P450 n=1 Tax=Diplogelasinospora grovesii TaxID=303347 RepID=A0AAN6MVT6_9PEZI|nr:cytochrome P450 [Diplogelasinospora grovesii]
MDITPTAKETTLPSLACAFGLLLLLYWTGSAVYSVLFHPLRHVPGPLLWRASRLGFIRSLVTGHLVHDVRKLHARYGDAVRTAPNEVSFAREDAWNDVFARGKPLPRNPSFFKAPPGQPDNLVTTVDERANARMRQVVMPAFTERALARQEPTVQAYVDLLIDRLVERAAGKEGAVINVVDWFNWLAFDLVGELALGESFGCLQNAKHHPWVTMIFNSLKVMALAAATRYQPGLEPFLLRLVPASIRKMQSDHYALAVSKIHGRMAAKARREDFISPMLDPQINPGFRKMSLPEVESTMSLLLIAGSETTGTTLCGTVNCLVQNPDKLQKLEREVRGTFSTETDITLRALQNLPFLNAAISEGLRLCNPVAGGILRTAPKGGATVCGYFLPEGTHVAVNSVAMSLSEANFYRATEFLPERFLPEGCGRPAHFDNDRRNTQKPFGLGPRSCVGKSFALAEMRLVLARLVWRFDICVAPGRRRIDWNKLKTFVVVQKEAIHIAIKEKKPAVKE